MLRSTVVGIERRSDHQWVKQYPEIDGALLAWANRSGEFSLEVPRKSTRPLDLFKIERYGDAQGEMPIKLMTTSVQERPLPQDVDPGAWRVKLEATADNASPATGYVAFRFDGRWPAAESIWKRVAVERTRGRPEDEPPVPEVRDAEEMLAEAGRRDGDA